MQDTLSYLKKKFPSSKSLSIFQANIQQPLPCQKRDFPPITLGDTSLLSNYQLFWFWLFRHIMNSLVIFSTMFLRQNICQCCLEMLSTLSKPQNWQKKKGESSCSEINRGGGSKLCQKKTPFSPCATLEKTNLSGLTFTLGTFSSRYQLHNTSHEIAKWQKQKI